MAFEGFPKGTTRFLRDLTAHNDKVWFDAHRERFAEVWTDPAKEFVSTVGPMLRKLVKTIGYDPRTPGSLMRQHRDTRFSADKSPYKTHFDLWFWDGDERGFGRPGFYFRLTADELMCGAGMHVFEEDQLVKYRAAVADAKRGAALAKLVEALRADGVDVGREEWKRVPKGFAPDHPRAELLRFGALHAGRTTPVPAELGSAALVDVVVERFREVNKVRAWLADALA